jgi:hypothetical protein
MPQSTVLFTHKWKTKFHTPCPLFMPCVECDQLLTVLDYYPSKSGVTMITGEKRSRRCKSCNIQAYKDLDPRLKLLYSAKQRAKKIGVECNLTINDIVIPKNCPALGLEIKDYTGGGKPDFSLHHDAATLDRIDNSKGYISGNVRVISKRANLLKKDATIEELMGILNYMKTAIAAKPVTHYEVQQ